MRKSLLGLATVLALSALPIFSIGQVINQYCKSVAGPQNGPNSVCGGGYNPTFIIQVTEHACSLQNTDCKFTIFVSYSGLHTNCTPYLRMGCNNYEFNAGCDNYGLQAYGIQPGSGAFGATIVCSCDELAQGSWVLFLNGGSACQQYCYTSCTSYKIANGTFGCEKCPIEGSGG